GPLTPIAQALLLSIYPPERKGTALGLFTMTVLLAPIFGPLLGGWISDHISWPWIFFINVPIGLICAYVCWNRLRHRETPISKDPIDRMGLALLVVGVGALQLMLDNGRELDWFESPHIVLMAIIAAISLTALLIWEWTAEHPIIDLHLFADRNFTVGTIALSLVFSLYMGIVVILPLWLQTQMGYTASWAGLVMAPSGVLAMVLMPTTGRNLHRMNVRLIISASCCILAFCCFLRSQFSGEVSFAYLSVPQWLQAIANAGLLLPLIALTLTNISPRDMASASGLTTFCRTLAVSVGTSLTTTLWDQRASVHHATLTEHINPYNSVFTDSIFNRIPNGYAVIEQIITRQAYMTSTIELFWLYGWLLLLVAPVIWLARPPKASAVPIVVAD